MRLDMYLKCTGIIPRRPLAKQACDEGLVDVNGRQSKASSEVRVGDRITTRVGMKVEKYEVLLLTERPVARARRDEYAKLVSSERVALDI